MLPVTMAKYLYYETPPTHNNRSRGAGGVWAEYVYS